MHKPYRFYIFYFLLAFLAYWQIGLFQNTLPWDMIDVYYPWRYFIGESLISGEFPLWNPYQNFGYPIHADMRSIWTPEIWLISLFGGYSIYTFSALFIVYTAISGIAMMHLSNYFLKHHRSAFFTGAVYMLSGYLTAHAQELYTINSFAFIPLVLYQYFRLKDDLCLSRAIYFLFFVFITLTSGYQAYSFILLYLLIAVFVYVSVGWMRQNDLKKLKKYLVYHVGLVLGIILLLLPIIVSAYQVFPYVTRLNSGVNIDTLSFFSFSPQSLLSLVLPFACVRDVSFFNTDVSMTNIYFGVVALVLALVSLFKVKKEGLFYLLLGFGVLSLLASFGTVTPVRGFLYEYVPFMNLFRGSAYFRLFMLIPMVIAFGYMIKNIETHRKPLAVTSALMLFLILGFVAYSAYHINWGEFSFLFSEDTLPQILKQTSTFYENIFLQGVLQILILGVLLFILLKKSVSTKYILILAVVDVLLAVQLNIYSTAATLFTPQEVHRFVASNPKGFPVPEQLKVKDCTDAKSSFGPLWKNTNMFTKRISGDAFNSFILDKTAYFKDSLPSVLNAVTDNYWLYFSGDIQVLSKIKGQDVRNSSLFIEDTLLEQYAHFQTNDVSSNTYRVTDFSPNGFSADVSVKNACFLNVIQTYYPGWNAYVDGKPVDIVETNTMFMGVPLSEGHHKLVFEYRNDVLVAAFAFSAFLFILILTYILWLKFRILTSRQKQYGLVLMLLLVALSVYQQYTYHTELNVFDRQLEKLLSNDATSDVIVDDAVVLDNYSQLKPFDFSNPINYIYLENILSQSRTDTLLLAWKNTFVDAKLVHYISTFYGLQYCVLDAGHSQIWQFSKKGQGLGKVYRNDFERNYADWHVNRDLIREDTLGHYYLRFDGQDFACSFSKMLTQKDVGKTLVAYVDYESEDMGVNPLLVFDISKNKHNIHWSSARAGKVHLDTLNPKRKILHALVLDEKMVGEEAQLKIFIWNKDKSQFKVDNFVIIEY